MIRTTSLISASAEGFRRWDAESVGVSDLGAVAAGVVGGAFAVAAIAKFVDPLAAAAAARRFGVGIPATARSGRLIAAIEAGAGAMILFAPTLSPWCVAPAIALSVAFLAMLLHTEARGERFPCACFGGGGTTGPAAIARAVALVALSAAATRSSPREAWLFVAAGITLVACVVACSALLTIRRAMISA